MNAPIATETPWPGSMQRVVRRQQYAKLMEIEHDPTAKRDWWQCEVCKERRFVSHEYAKTLRLKCTCGNSVVVNRKEPCRLTTVQPHQIDGYLQHTTIASGEILDLVKKHVAYNQQLNVPVLLDELNTLEYMLCRLRQANGLTLEQVLEANIAKLSKRYPGLVYTDDAAKVRADKEGGEA